MGHGCFMAVQVGSLGNVPSGGVYFVPIHGENKLIEPLCLNLDVAEKMAETLTAALTNGAASWQAAIAAVAASSSFCGDDQDRLRRAAAIYGA